MPIVVKIWSLLFKYVGRRGTTQNVPLCVGSSKVPPVPFVYGTLANCSECIIAYNALLAVLQTATSAL